MRSQVLLQAAQVHALYCMLCGKGARPLLAINDELAKCMSAKHQQVLEAHANGHQAWSALVVGRPGHMSFLGTPCSF